MIILMLSAEVVCSRACPRHYPGAGRPIRESLRCAGFRWHPDALLWSGARPQAVALQRSLAEQRDHLDIEVGRVRPGTHRHAGLVRHLDHINIALDVLREELSDITNRQESP